MRIRNGCILSYTNRISVKIANEKMTSGDAKILEKTGPPHEEDRMTVLSKSFERNTDEVSA